MCQFLERKSSDNLLNSVLHDIKVPEFVAGAKALGLISRLVTGPLWCLLEDKTVHVLDANENYLRLVYCLADASANLPDFILGNMLVFGVKTVINKDSIYEPLISDWEHDNKAVYLAIILPAIDEVSRKLFNAHLSCGRWENSTEEMRKRSTGTPKHKFLQSVFGFLDQLLRKKT